MDTSNEQPSDRHENSNTVYSFLGNLVSRCCSYSPSSGLHLFPQSSLPECIVGKQEIETSGSAAFVIAAQLPDSPQRDQGTDTRSSALLKMDRFSGLSPSK